MNYVCLYKYAHKNGHVNMFLYDHISRKLKKKKLVKKILDFKRIGKGSDP